MILILVKILLNIIYIKKLSIFDYILERERDDWEMRDTIDLHL